MTLNIPWMIEQLGAIDEQLARVKDEPRAFTAHLKVIELRAYLREHRRQEIHRQIEAGTYDVKSKLPVVVGKVAEELNGGE